MSPHHECVVYITEKKTSDFLSIFLRASFSKCFMKILAITGKIEEPMPLLKFVHKICCYKRSKLLNSVLLAG